MEKRFDVLGIGCVAVDDLFYVGAYPPADSKLRVRRTERKFGGLTGTALVTAAKLGAKCAFAGLLGHDDLSRAVEQNFTRHGIDVSDAVRKPEASPIRSAVIVADDGTRTLFYDSSAPVGASIEGPSEALILASKVLFVDHIGIAGAIRAADIAHRHGISIVCDFEEDVGEFIDVIDHLVLCAEFALASTSQPDPCAAARALWSANRDTVVVTCGAEGAVYISKDQPGVVQTTPAFKVKAIDTTGCGDVFHGAYSCALAEGLDTPTRIRFAAGAAALKAATGEIPTRDELSAFLLKEAL